MLRRNLNSDFVGGAYVFPGGAVDPARPPRRPRGGVPGSHRRRGVGPARHRRGRPRLLGGGHPRELRGGRRAAGLRPRRRRGPPRRSRRLARCAEHRRAGRHRERRLVEICAEEGLGSRSTPCTTSATGSPRRVRPGATTPGSSWPPRRRPDPAARRPRGHRQRVDPPVRRARPPPRRRVRDDPPDHRQPPRRRPGSPPPTRRWPPPPRSPTCPRSCPASSPTRAGCASCCPATPATTGRHCRRRRPATSTGRVRTAGTTGSMKGHLVTAARDSRRGDRPRRPRSADAPKPLVPDVASALSPLVRRIVGDNPGMMTGPGTNTYLVGIDEIVVIDPGPDDADPPRRHRRLRRRSHPLDRLHPHPPRPLARVPPVCKSARAPRSSPSTAATVWSIDRALGDGDAIEATEFRLPPCTRPATRRTTCASCSRRSGCSSPATTSWTGPPSSSARPTATWRPTSSSLERLQARRPALRAIAPGHGRLIDDPGPRSTSTSSTGDEREAPGARSAADARHGTGTRPSSTPSTPTWPSELHPVARRSVWAHLRKLAGRGPGDGVDPDDPDATWVAA